MAYLGDPRAVCDICQLEYRLSQLRKNWKGQMVCPQDYEDRHPQDFLRPVREALPSRDVRPERPDTFITGESACMLTGRSAIPDYAVPDCSIPDWTPSF